MKKIFILFICLFLFSNYIVPIADTLNSSYQVYKAINNDDEKYVPVQYEEVMTKILQGRQEYTDEIAEHMDLQVYNMLTPTTKSWYNPEEKYNSRCIYLGNQYPDTECPDIAYVDVYIFLNGDKHIFSKNIAFVDRMTVLKKDGNWKIIYYGDSDKMVFGYWKPWN